MELLQRLFVLLFLARASFSTVVTLEGGQTGVAVKEVNTDTDQVLLSCSVTFSVVGGTPNVEWTLSKDPNEEGSHLYYDGFIVGEASKYTFLSPSSLTVHNVNPSDNGYYKCRAVIPGDTPSAASATYNLVVLVGPYDQISCGFPQDLAITIGQSAEFRCAEVVAQANPAPTYKWFKDGAELPLKASDNKAMYPNSSFSYSTETGILKFQTVISKDKGKYHCTATNKVGSNECTAADITTKEVNVGQIVGIVFGVLFAVILVGVLIWWTYRRGYCDSFIGEKDQDFDAPDDGANDIMLDGVGPLVTKAPSEYSNGTSHKQEASMMI